MPADLAFWLIVLAIPVGTLAWAVWDHRIRPALAGKQEIRDRAARLVAERNVHAVAAAAAMEAAAHARGDHREQGIWRRVHRLLAHEAERASSA